jgi:hypothetical protein
LFFCPYRALQCQLLRCITWIFSKSWYQSITVYNLVTEDRVPGGGAFLGCAWNRRGLSCVTRANKWQRQGEKCRIYQLIYLFSARFNFND